MRNLECDCKQHKHAEFFRKFDKVFVQPPDVILDEHSHKLWQLKINYLIVNPLCVSVECDTPGDLGH